MRSGDIERAMAVLEGFDLVARIGEDFIVPGVLSHAVLPAKPTLDIPQCQFRVELGYSSLPPGSFESMVVHTAKQYPYAFEFSAVTATFYDTHEHIAQLICYRDKDAKSRYKEDETAEFLILRSNSVDMMKHLEGVVNRMERSFAGLIRLKRDEKLSKLRVDQSTSPFVSESLVTRQVQPFTSKLSSHMACSHCAQCAASEAYKLSKLSSQGACPHCATSELTNANDFQVIFQVITCSACLHKISLRDLLTTFRAPEYRDCPVCVEKREKYPGSFSAGECRLRSNRHFGLQMRTISCYTCLAGERSGQICVDDVAPPEVYVGGLNVLDPKMQLIVIDWLQLIELEADIRCSYHLNLNASNELADTGLKGAMFVLILLSDAYAASTYESETVWGISKRSMHIIMPQWTGQWGQDYLKQSTDLLNSSANINFATPRRFPSVNDKNLISSQEARALLAQDIAQDIKLHLQRPGRLDTYSDFSMLGIKLSFLDSIIQSSGGPSALKEHTTERFTDVFVKPATKESRLSYCELLKSQGRTDIEGTAEWFYSHAWKFRFLEVVDAAKRFFGAEESGPEGDPFVWFDVFSVSQHKASVRPFEWWNGAFFNAIGSIGKVLMLMQPFEDPRTGTPAWTTLTRVWCVFELYACESTMARFEVTMTEEMAKRFQNVLVGKGTEFLSTLIAIDCAQSEAKEPEDKLRVFEVIERTIGFPLLNSMVVKVLERWVYSELLKTIKPSAESAIAGVQKSYSIPWNPSTGNTLTKGTKLHYKSPTAE